MISSFTCECGRTTKFVFGKTGRRWIDWGDCDTCKNGYKMAQKSESRRRARTAEGRLRKRKCQKCEQEYRPLRGRRNTKHCPDCVIEIRDHRYMIRYCSTDGCTVVMGKSQQKCPTHREERIRSTKANQLIDKKLRRAAVAKRQLTKCMLCPVKYDWRLTQSRQKAGQVDICPTCYSNPKIRADLGISTPNPQRHKPS
jgi:hypothetical protein